MPGTSAAISAAILIAAAGAATTARADGSTTAWSPAITLSTDVQDGVFPVQSTDGAWLGLRLHGSGSYLRTLPASGGAPGPERRVRDVADVGAYANRAVYLHDLSRGRYGISIGTLGSTALGATRIVDRHGSAIGLVVGPGGDVVVPTETAAHERQDGNTDGHVGVIWSTAAHRSRWHPTALPGRTQLLGLAVDAHGDATILFQRITSHGTRVAARVLDTRTGRLGAERTLDRRGDDRVDGDVAVDAHGHAVLAWGKQDGGEEANTSFVVKAAFRHTSGSTFSTARTLESGGPRNRPDAPVQAAMDASGRATVAWSAPIGRTTNGESATVPRTTASDRPGTLGAPHDLLASGRVVDAAAVGETTLVSVEGGTAPVAADADSTPAVTTRGVFAHDGTADFGPLDPVTDAPGGTAPSLVAGATAFRAVWRTTGDRPAVRTATRPATPAARRIVSEPIVVRRTVAGATRFVVAYELDHVDDTHEDLAGRTDRGATVNIQTPDGQATYSSGQAPYWLRSPNSRCYYAEIPPTTPPAPALEGLPAGGLVHVEVTDRAGQHYDRSAHVLADRTGRTGPEALSKSLGCLPRYRTEADRAWPTLDPNSPACEATKDGFPAACAAQF